MAGVRFWPHLAKKINTGVPAVCSAFGFNLIHVPVQAVVGGIELAAAEPFDFCLVEIIFQNKIPFFAPGIVEMFLNPSVVHGFGGPELDRLIPEFPDFFKPGWIDAAQGFPESPAMAHEVQDLGLFKEFIPEFGIGQTDHGRGPLLEVTYFHE